MGGVGGFGGDQRVCGDVGGGSEDAAGRAGGAAAQEAPESLPVDLVLPNSVKTRLPSYLPSPLARVADGPVVVAGTGEQGVFTEPATAFPTGRTRANLKIQEGCDFFCAYCIVPHVRGAPRSRERSDVLREAEALVSADARELVLTGVHTSLYRSPRGGLTELLDAILALGEGFRVRVSSLEPGPEIPALVERMASVPRICPFLHLPVQHADDGVLQRMRRRTGFAEFADLVGTAVERIPGVCIGTDVMVGFPGEDEGAFETCLERLAGLPLGLMHVFPFSPRPGTVAAEFAHRPDGVVVERRRQRMLELAREKAEAFVASQIGRTVEVLTERRTADLGAEGWSGNYLRVRFEGGEVPPNRLVRCRLTRAGEGRVAQGVVLP